MTPRLVALAGATAIAVWSSGANAQNVGGEAPDRPGFSVGGLVGIETSGFGFGIGARAGYTLPFHLYLGGNIGYNFGSGGDHVFSVAPEVGYDIALWFRPPILLRPYLDVGFALVSEGATTQTNNNVTISVPGGTSGAFLFSPGVLGLYDIVPNVFVGVDLRVPIYSAGSSVGFAGFLTAGYRM
jgi:hypothetical protein